MRRNQIFELLEEIKETYETLKSYKKISRPKVKSVFEHLRSCLEYSAQDINEKLSKPKIRNFYFPYGENLEKFNDSLKIHLPLIPIELPDIYDEMVKLHQFNLNDKWLKNLCDLTNTTKHKNAIDIRREEVQESTLISANGINIAQIGVGCKNIVFKNNRVNGKRIDDFSINDNQITITRKSEIPVSFRISKSKKILIGDNQLDLLPFLNKCINNIEIFIDNLYKKLDKA